MVIVGIKHLHDIFGQVSLFHSLLIITLVKGIQREAFHRLCIPDSQGIHNAVAITHDGQIIGNGTNGLVVLLEKNISAILVNTDIYMTAEFYFLRIFGAAQLEGIAILQPVIRDLALIAVLDLLFKHTVAITDAAAIRRISQGSQGIHKAGSQTPQTAIAQCRIRLLVLNDIQIQSQLLQSLLHILVALQVDHIIAQRAPHQELHGHIIDHLGVFLVIGLLRLHPMLHDLILDRIGHSLKDLLRSSLLQLLAVKCLYIVKYTPLEQLLVEGKLVLLCCGTCRSGLCR